MSWREWRWKQGGSGMGDRNGDLDAPHENEPPSHPGLSLEHGIGWHDDLDRRVVIEALRAPGLRWGSRG